MVRGQEPCQAERLVAVARGPRGWTQESGCRRARGWALAGRPEWQSWALGAFRTALGEARPKWGEQSEAARGSGQLCVAGRGEEAPQGQGRSGEGGLGSSGNQRQTH